LKLTSTGTVSLAGGTFILGDGASTKTASGTGYLINSTLPITNLVVQGGGIVGRNAFLITNLTVNNTLTMKSGSISLNGNTLTLGGSSTLAYSGSSAQSTGSELLASLNNLTIGNSAGVTLGGSTTVGGTLTFTAGNLSLGADTLTISGTVTGASAGKCVVTNGSGVVSRSISSAQNFWFPIGPSTASYNPVYIGNPAGGGVFTALVTAISPAAPAPAYGLNYMWTLTGSAGATTLSFQWSGANAGANLAADPAHGYPWTYSTSWTEAPGGSCYTGGGEPYTSNVSTSTPAGNWTIGVTGALPVELASFAATANRLCAELHWSTSTEVDNSGFEIERKSGTAAWTKVGFVQGVGTSTSLHNYSYDDLVPQAGLYEYRLKQIDRGGAYKYSSVMQVEVGSAPKILSLGSNYPNPFNPTTDIEFSVPLDGRATLKVYNILGQEVATLFSGNAEAGKLIKATFDASRLSSGVYFSRLEFGGNALVRRMMLVK
jgi:hypothetical protein